jgi:hypothetical protein
LRSVSKDANRDHVVGNAPSAGSLGGGSDTAVLTPKVRDAGLLSIVPEGSTARTETVWDPSARGAVECGLEQEVKLAESTRHWKLEPATVAANPKDGVGLSITDPAAGPAVIAVSTVCGLPRLAPLPSASAANDRAIRNAEQTAARPVLEPGLGLGRNHWEVGEAGMPPLFGGDARTG